MLGWKRSSLPIFGALLGASTGRIKAALPGSSILAGPTEVGTKGNLTAAVLQKIAGAVRHMDRHFKRLLKRVRQQNVSISLGIIEQNALLRRPMPLS
jgi:hypothetical protein